MRFRSTGPSAAAVVVMVGATFLASQSAGLAARDSKPGKDGKDDVVGVIWHYTLTRGKQKDTGQFRVYDGKIYKADKPVGKYTQTGDKKTTITFTDWPEMNGKVSLTKTERHPPRANGTLKKDDGTEWEMHVTWKDG